MNAPRPVPVPRRAPYVPILSDLERRAYHAAHRILTERPYISRLAAPGGQRSAAVDGLAEIIMQVFKKEN